MSKYAPPTRPRIVAAASQKGGTSKTTSTISLAGSLVLREKKVLVIDLDPQANASVGLDIIISPEALGTRLLLQDDRYSIADCVYAKGTHLDVIPSHRTLIDIQQQLLLDPAGRMRLKNKLKEGGKNYDFIFLDTPPDIGALTQSALIASTDVLVPIDLGYFAIDGLENMLDIIEQVRNVYNPNLNLFGILLTKYDARTTLARSTQEVIRAKGLPLLEPPIRICVEIIRSQLERVPIEIFAPHSTAAADYAAIAEQLLHPIPMVARNVVPLRQQRG